MDPLELEAANASIQETLQWKPSKIMIELQQHGTEDKTTIDLASIITKPLANAKGISSHPEFLIQKCNHIPSCVFDGVKDNKERKKRVTGCLQNACRQAGFAVVAGRSKLTCNGRIKKHRYHCPRHRHKTDSRIPEDQRKINRKSGRPTRHEPCCTFNFTICEDTSSNMFFFSKI